MKFLQDRKADETFYIINLADLEAEQCVIDSTYVDDTLETMIDYCKVIIQRESHSYPKGTPLVLTKLQPTLDTEEEAKKWLKKHIEEELDKQYKILREAQSNMAHLKTKLRELV